MKIGIITFNSAHNYGAVLQVWALQEKLKNEGHQVEVINYRIPAIDNLYQVYVPRWISNNSMVNRVCHKLQYMKARVRTPEKSKRYKKFEKFIREVLPSTRPYHSYEALRNAQFDYDLLITGSDQVWNGNITRGISGAYFLAFGDENVKRISYAASIGKDAFDEEEKVVVQKYLKGLDYISVREEKAKNAVEELTDKEVDLVLDPTLLLDKEKYDKLKKPFPVKGGDYIFVHNVHLVKVDARLNAIVEEISARTGLPVVNNRADYSFKNEIAKFSEGGPEEFLGVIDGAKFVITNSFHATVFSTIYEKKFITVPHFKNPDRMRNLLQLFELENHLIAEVKDIPKDLSELDIDYAKVNELRKKARVTSEAYLQKALKGPKTVPEAITPEKKYLQSKDKFSCYGCGLCRELSPDAICMKRDEEGIFYPQIIEGQEEKAKETVCLYGNESAGRAIKAAYTAHLSAEEELEVCSGGGVMKALAEEIWKQGGVVAGIGYYNSLFPEYHLAENIEEANGFFMEKYVEETFNDIFSQVKNELAKGRKVLFMGSASKVDALYHFLGKEEENLYTVQILGKALASQKVYEKYLESLEQSYGSKVVKVEFDNKIRTAQKPYTCITFASGDIYVSSAYSNLFMYAVRRGHTTRHSMYTSKYMEKGIAVADFTVKNNSTKKEAFPMGEDMLCVHTEKGEKLLSLVANQLVMQPYEEAELKQRVPLTEGRTLLMNKMEQGEDMQEIILFNRQKKK